MFRDAAAIDVLLGDAEMRTTRLWLTTPAGLEGLAAAECAECPGWLVERTERGVVEVSVAADCPQDIVRAARKLRLVQRLLAFVLRETLPVELDRDQTLAFMQERACHDGGPALVRLAPLWRAFSPSHSAPDEELAFHVRAQRGGCHSFSSDDAKRRVALGLTAGSGLRGACRLEFQLNVDVRVHHESVWAGLCLLNTRQEAATIAASSTEPAPPPRELSVTTLNSTIAHAMLRALRPHAGALVVDPMAGCGTLTAGAGVRGTARARRAVLLPRGRQLGRRRRQGARQHLRCSSGRWRCFARCGALGREAAAAARRVRGPLRQRPALW